MPQPTATPRPLVASVAFLVLTVALPARAAEITLGEALDSALRLNLEIRQEQIDLEVAGLAVQRARGAWDPGIWASAAAGGASSLTNSILDATEGGVETVRSGSRTWSAGLSQDIITGGSATMGWYETLSTSDSQSQVLSESIQAGGYLSVSQPLLQGAGALAAQASLRDAMRGEEQEILSYRAALEALVVQVCRAYWRLVSAEETLVLANRSLSIAQGQLQDTEERRAEGFAALGDVLQVKRAAGVARQAVVVAEAEVEAARAGLSRLTGLADSASDPLEPVERPVVPDLVLDLERSMGLARGKNAQWLQSHLSVKAAEDALKLARNSARPSLGLTGSAGFSGLAASRNAARAQVFTGDYQSWSLGMDLAVPLPGRAGRSEVAAARLALERARLGLEAAEQDLLLEVEGAMRAVRRDRQRVDLARQTVEAARAALDADQELVREGRGSTRDVVRSLESLDSAQAAMLRAEIDLQNSLTELMRSEGTVLARLRLVGAHDPLPPPSPE